MQPEDAFDAIHLSAAAEVDRFANALEDARKLPPAEAHAHADNAYLYVEFLANTYPKMPRDATERDAWLFLFDYAITQSPFAGLATRIAPRSVALFVEFLATRGRVAELGPIREACAMEDFYRTRVETYATLAKRAQTSGVDPRDLQAAVDDWWEELDQRMRPRGLVPDASLAGGSEAWSPEMGPLEAAVFDAVCMVLSRRARELAARGADEAAVERALLRAQREFMLAPNKGLGKSPLEAIAGERVAIREWVEEQR